MSGEDNFRRRSSDKTLDSGIALVVFLVVFVLGFAGYSMNLGKLFKYEDTATLTVTSARIGGALFPPFGAILGYVNFEGEAE